MTNLNQLFSPILEIPADHNIYPIAGTVGARLENGALVAPADVESQTELMLDNVEAKLGSLGLSLAHMRSVDAFLADINDYAAFNEIYARRFEGKLIQNDVMPTRTVLGGLVMPRVTENTLLVEMKGIASIHPEELRSRLLRKQLKNRP